MPLAVGSGPPRCARLRPQAAPAPPACGRSQRSWPVVRSCGRIRDCMARRAHDVRHTQPHLPAGRLAPLTVLAQLPAVIAHEKHNGLVLKAVGPQRNEHPPQVPVSEGYGGIVAPAPEHSDAIGDWRVTGHGESGPGIVDARELGRVGRPGLVLRERQVCGRRAIVGVQLVEAPQHMPALRPASRQERRGGAARPA